MPAASSADRNGLAGSACAPDLPKRKNVDERTEETRPAIDEASALPLFCRHSL